LVPPSGNDYHAFPTKSPLPNVRWRVKPATPGRAPIGGMLNQFGARPFQNRTKTLCYCGFGAYLEREADSPKLLRMLEPQSKIRSFPFP
jgi:hypothetical protein